VKLTAAIHKLFPELYEALRSVKFFYLCRKRFWKHQQYVKSFLYKDGDICVQTGPFMGLKYYNKTVWGPIVPKWLGSYESQLIPVIEKIIKSRPSRIIDIGAAEGYYAIGLAKLLKQCEVAAFDIDPIARIRQKQLASINNTRNLNIYGLCSPEKLNAFAGKDSVVICDIEGGELDLIDPQRAPALFHTRILIECHRAGSLAPEEVATKISQRFISTHRAERIYESDCNWEEWRRKLPKLRVLTSEEFRLSFQEYREIKQVWLWLEPHSSEKTSNASV